jgi:hypothetical protein
MKFLFPIALLAFLPCSPLSAQAAPNQLPLLAPHEPLPEALSGEESVKLLKSVDRGLAALQKEQQEDGSFKTISYGQPAVTALAVMAYLSRGHKPGQGPYGESLEKAINYVLTKQKKSGLFSHTEIDYARLHEVPEPGEDFDIMAAQTYNHAISMLMLGEVYGLMGEKEDFRLRDAITKGLTFTIQLWDIRKKNPTEDGGFRYTRPWSEAEADVSVTGWHAASLRSIRNAGFEIPQPVIDRLVGYLARNQLADGGFGYRVGRRSTFTMTAAGTLCVVLAGKHDDPVLARAASYLYRFDVNSVLAFDDTSRHNGPYYGCYYMSQAAIQLGGRVWVKCMRQVYTYLIQKQDSTGYWMPEGPDTRFGKAYTTSMAILALTPPLQLLPIYQR